MSQPKPKKSGKDKRAAFRQAIPFGIDMIGVNRIDFKRKWADEIGLNISEQGLCCCSYQALPERATIRCLIMFPPPHDEHVIRGEAQLIWQKSQQTRQDTAWFHGFKFTKLAKSDRDILKRVLTAHHAGR